MDYNLLHLPNLSQLISVCLTHLFVVCLDGANRLFEDRVLLLFQTTRRYVELIDLHSKIFRGPLNLGPERLRALYRFLRLLSDSVFLAWSPILAELCQFERSLLVKARETPRCQELLT